MGVVSEHVNVVVAVPTTDVPATPTVAVAPSVAPLSTGNEPARTAHEPSGLSSTGAVAEAGGIVAVAVAVSVADASCFFTLTATHSVPPGMAGVAQARTLSPEGVLLQTAGRADLGTLIVALRPAQVKLEVP